MQQIRRCSFAYEVMVPCRFRFCHNPRSSSGTPTPTSGSRPALTGLHTTVEFKQKCAIEVLVMEMHSCMIQCPENVTVNACACACMQVVHCGERHASTELSKIISQQSACLDNRFSGIFQCWLSHVTALKVRTYCRNLHMINAWAI